MCHTSNFYSMNLKTICFPPSASHLCILLWSHNTITESLVLFNVTKCENVKGDKYFLETGIIQNLFLLNISLSYHICIYFWLLQILTFFFFLIVPSLCKSRVLISQELSMTPSTPSIQLLPAFALQRKQQSLNEHIISLRQ